MHFLDGKTGRSPGSSRPEDVVVRLACERHDPGGYWFSLAQYALTRKSLVEHLKESKAWRGDLALERAGFG